ncbi:MAG TPA: extracellular solute-binding protein [Fimbriimonas sp.]|nr:extracellular solute-binding protein [Fimbriimonas sp.]
MLRRIATVLCLLVGIAHAWAGEIIENTAYKGPKTIIAYAMWGGAGEVENARVIGKQFVQIHPEIALNISVFPWGQYWAKVQTQTASGLAPDVLSFYSGAFGVWVARGALRPLDDLAEEAGFNKVDYQPVAIENCTWNGKLYAMPMEIPVWTVVYSQDKLEQSGIPRSEWPKADQPLTWEEFHKLAKRLTLRNPDGTFAQYGMAAGQNWTNVMQSMHGGFLTDRQVNPTKPTVRENEELKRALIELYQASYGDRWILGAEPLASGSFTASSDTLLLSNRFAMGTTGPWALKQLKDGGVRFGLMPMPRNDHPIQLINVNSVGIYSASKHPKEAFKLLQYMASLPVQRLYGSRLKGVPVLKAAESSFINNEYGIKGVEAYLHDMSIAKPAVTPDNTYIKQAFDKWMKSAEQKMDSEYDRRLGALKKPISRGDYQKFVAGMNGFVAETIDGSWKELAVAVDDAFAKAKNQAPTPFVRNVAPLMGLIGFIGLIGAYLWSVRRTEREPAGISGLRRTGIAGYLFIAPWLIGFTCFLLGPIIAAVFLSFTEWNMISAPKWVGAQHYVGLPHDEKFLIGLSNTLKYAAIVIPISLIGGLTTAGLLTARIKGSDFFKALIYFPALFTGAEAAVLWVNMLNKEYGILNFMLGKIGIAPINWMDEAHAFNAVVLMNVFWIGGAMLIYYAGMKQIPATLYEAAEIDGATPMRRFMKITIPLLSPVILFMVVMTTIGAFQVFTPALFFADSSTNIGQPGDALRFYAVNIYDTAFNNLRMGDACAYALVLFLIIFAITMVQMRLAKRFVHSEGA